MALYPYTQGEQIEKYLHQFMRVMSGFQVSTGDKDANNRFITRRVPVVYGGMSRIVATKLNNRETFTNKKIPMLAVNMTGLEIDPSKRRSTQHKETVTTTGHENTPRVVERLIGPPFNMTVDVTLYASSMHELFLVLEQILLVFNERVRIQNSSNALDHNYITEISLASIQNEINYPMGMDRRIVSYTLSFMIPIRLRYPFKTNENFIDTINKNVFEENEEEDVEIDGLYEELNNQQEQSV